MFETAYTFLLPIKLRYISILLAKETGGKKLAKGFELMNVIIERNAYGSQLDSFEEYMLCDKLNSPFFRNIVKGYIPTDPIEHIVSMLDMMFVFIDENIELRELNIRLSREIETKKQYNIVKKKAKNIVRELPEFKKLFLKESIQEAGEFLKFIIIPDILFHKITLISNLGETYYRIRNLFRSFAILGSLDYQKLDG